MIALATYLETAKRLADQTTEYRIRGDCRNGKGDCVGLDIGILRECGINYKGLHSSNEFPRKYTVGLRRIRKVSELEPGMMIWKAKEPGDAGYDLPKRYAGGADLRDYYHQGIVLSVVIAKAGVESQLFIACGLGTGRGLAKSPGHT